MGLHWRAACRVLAPLLLLAVSATLAAAPSAAPLGSPACLERLLRELGWRIEYAAIAQPRVEGGQPCRRASLADAWAQGDLRLLLPTGYDAARTRRSLEALLDDPATHCAYAFRVGDAARRAALRLQGNPGYRFSAVQAGWIGFGWNGARTQGWESFRSLGRGYRPAAGNSAALDAFYRGRVRSECGVGRQVAQLATQRELYGDAGFDAAFSADELSIGTFLSLHETDSILLGRRAGEFLADGKAVRTARLGRQAFVGMPGFIEHAYSKWYLDDISNRAENFMVVEVGQAAADALAAHGGLAYYDRLNHRLWALSRQLDGGSARYFERLLFEHDAKLRARLDPREREVVAQMDAVLADPFYGGFVIYVHPRGIRPIGYHLARLLDRNPRTPFTIDLALNNLHSTLYHRWIAYRLDHCGQGAPAGPDATMR